jgi:electron transfer flavoprotein beta subunit
MLSGLLGWSIGTFVSRLQVEDAVVRVTREVDGGLENIELVQPAIVTVDLRLNEPRYASLPNIMKAKKKPLDTFTPEALGVDVSPRLETIRVINPPARAAGARVTSAAELVDKLRNEAKVI